jgi:hypothetical protein
LPLLFEAPVELDPHRVGDGVPFRAGEQGAQFALGLA